MNSRKFTKRTLTLLSLLILFSILIAGGSLASTNNITPIRLQYATFDPIQGEPFVPAPLKSSLPDPDGAGGHTYLVQFNGPVREAWKAQVEAAGGRLYGYIPDHAFIARLDVAAFQKVSLLDAVRWVGPYHPAYRLAPSLSAEAQTPSQVEASLTLETLPDANLDELTSQIEAWGGTVVDRTANRFSGYMQVILAGDRAGDLSALEGVVWVEPTLELKLLNDIASGGIMHADSVGAALGLDGSGQVVGVADSGLDTGDMNNLHPDVSGRVTAAYCRGRPSPCDWSDFIGHGTHVVGSVLGNGAVSGGLYAGLAPGAHLVMQSVADAAGGLAGIPFDRGDLMRQAHADGARVHSNSWGGPTGQINPFGGYPITSQQVDQVTWDTPYRNMLVLFAAGNDGVDGNKDGLVDSDSIEQPGTAKNVLTVGASENDRAAISAYWGSAYGQPIASDLRSDDPSGMAAFSSRGPTDDGRIKPDLVAPGTFIASLRTRQYAFNDNLEGDTSGYNPNFESSGIPGTTPWVLRSDGEAHSGSHYWKQTLSGSYPTNSLTFLLTPPFDVRPTGGAFEVYFWHKFALSTGDTIHVLLFDGANNFIDYVYSGSGNQGAYQMRREIVSLSSIPSTLRLGFAIQSDGSSNSQWWLDDIRVEGLDWSPMSSVGLAQAGDAIDEAYVMNGGTSMATPLTAGAAALTREWLVEQRGFPEPSGALMKAVLINGAADMSPGQYTSPQEVPNHRPNNVTGWGRVDLAASLKPPSPRQIWLRENTTGLTTGGSASYTLEVDAAQAAALTQGAPSSTPQPPSSGAAGPSLPSEFPDSLLDQTPHIAQTPEAPRSLEIHRGKPALTLVEGNAPTVPSSALDVSQLIQNGGFETAGSWTTVTTTRTTEQSFSGSWSMASTPASDGFFYQTVVFPSETISATLEYYYNNDPPDDGYDVHQVLIYDENFNYLGEGPLLSDDNADWGGVQLTFNTDFINQIKGQTINIVFLVDQDDVSPDAVFYFDDVALYVGTPGTPTTPTPTATTTPTPTPTTTQPPQTGGPLRLTLVWTDFPGSTTAAKALVNDLDLEVIAPDGTHYYGNSGLYTSGACLRDGQWDACNNVEGVFIPDALYGQYTILVHGPEIPSGPQPFALVASGDNLLGTAGPQVSIYLPMIRR